MGNKHEPCPTCGSKERTSWIHGWRNQGFVLGNVHVFYGSCFRYCRGCSSIEIVRHKDHNKIKMIESLQRY